MVVDGAVVGVGGFDGDGRGRGCGGDVGFEARVGDFALVGVRSAEGGGLNGGGVVQAVAVGVG